MGKQPLVSIVVPVYNDEDTIEVCLRTLIKQTYPSKEIIVVDDGSTDNTANLLVRIGKDHPSLRIVSVEHGGISKARNIGLKHSRGGIVFFGEGDAIYHCDYLKKAVEVLDKDARIGGVCLTGAPWVVRYTFVTECIDVENKIQRKLLASGKMQVFYAWVFRKDAVTAAEGFDERLFQGEDKDFFLRVKQKGCSIGLMTGVNWRHRRNQTLWDFVKRNFAGAKTRVLYLLKHNRIWELAQSVGLLWFVILVLPFVSFFPSLIYLILIAMSLPILNKLIFLVRFGGDVINKKKYLVFVPFFSFLRYMTSAAGYSYGLFIAFFLKLRGKKVDWSSM